MVNDWESWSQDQTAMQFDAYRNSCKISRIGWFSDIPCLHTYHRKKEVKQTAQPNNFIRQTQAFLYVGFSWN